LHCARCEFYLLIYVEVNFYVSILENRYDKILKTNKYFQTMKINVVLCYFFYFIYKTLLNICFEPVADLMFSTDTNFYSDANIKIQK